MKYKINQQVLGLFDEIKEMYTYARVLRLSQLLSS